MLRTALVSVLVLSVCWAGAMPLGVGSKVPDVTIAKEGGKALKLADSFSKKAGTILYFWSFETGAHPDDFVALQTCLATYNDLGIVAICSDGRELASSHWKEEIGCTYDFAVEASAQRATTRLFGVKRYPTVFVVNREGMITHRFDKFDETKIREAVAGLGCTVKEGQ